MKAPPSISDHIPLKPVDYLVLMVLDRGDRHGYGIVQDVELESQGQVRLVPGNLYAVLRRLMDKGLIEQAAGQEPGARGKARRYYGLTDFGRAVLVEEARRLRRLVARSEAQDLLGPAESG